MLTSGLLRLRQAIVDPGVRPAMWSLMAMELVSAEAGSATFHGRPGSSHYNGMGTVHGGYAASILDSAMACAIQSTLDGPIAYTTAEFKISFIRSMTSETGLVEAVGRTLSSGRKVATAEGFLRDSSGRLLAHGTTTCIILG